MTTAKLAMLTLAMISAPGMMHAQSGKAVDLSGTWEAPSPDGPVTVIVRPDSSASFGDEIVRWRIVSDTVYLAIGGEWLGYNYAFKGSTLVLSGGDRNGEPEGEQHCSAHPRTPLGVYYPQ